MRYVARMEYHTQMHSVMQLESLKGRNLMEDQNIDRWRCDIKLDCEEEAGCRNVDCTNPIPAERLLAFQEGFVELL
jgi:hypothetical protein